MPRYPTESAPRSLVDAAVRDLVILGFSVAICVGLQQWVGTEAGLLGLSIAGIVSFLLAFAVIYLSHEWGHYIGARLGGADIPLGSSSSAFLGLFNPALYSRRQFQFMALGGEVGYMIPSILLMALFWDTSPLQGLAVAGAAFIIQSLYVDVPVLWAIHKGADIQKTLDEGTAPPVLARKTSISWVMLAVGITTWSYLG